MRIAIHRRFFLALLPGLLVSSAITGAEPRLSARRTSYQKEPLSEVATEPSLDCGTGAVYGDELVQDTDSQLDVIPVEEEPTIVDEDGVPQLDHDDDYQGGCDVQVVDDLNDEYVDGGCDAKGEYGVLNVDEIGSDPYGFCPCWTVRAGAVILRRESNTSIALATGTPSYNTGDLGFDFEVGPQFTAIRHGIFNSLFDFEVGYFGVSDWGGRASTADIDTFATTPAIVVGGVTPAATTYSSKLDNVELNLRRPVNDWVTLIGGFRWIEVGEDLDTTIGAASTHSVDVNNHMYGLQLGADALLYRRGAWSLETFGKAGIYANNSDSRTTTVGIGGALPVVVAERDSTSFVADTALTVAYDINSRWSIRSGYQLFWIDGIALAPEQLDNVNIATGAATVDTQQTSFYHGFTVAAQMMW